MKYYAELPRTYRAVLLGSLLPFQVLAGVHSANSIPWNVNVEFGSPQDAAAYIDLPPSVFAPNGRLYSVEAAFHACEDESDQSSNTALAIRCREGVVVVTTSSRSPYIFNKNEIKKTETLNEFDLEESFNQSLLVNEDDVIINYIDEQSSHKDMKPNAIFRPPFAAILTAASNGFYSTSDVILGITGGNAADSQIVRRKLLRIGDYARSTESSITVGGAARRFADQQQILSQHGGKGRVLASMVLLLSASEIWRIEPSGQFWQCQAAAVGRNSRIVERLLLDKVSSLHQELLQSTNNDKWSSRLRLNSAPSSQQASGDIDHFLWNLTIEEILGLSTKCIIEAMRCKGNENPNSLSMHTYLKAVSMKINAGEGSSHGIRFYNQRQLLDSVILEKCEK